MPGRVIDVTSRRGQSARRHLRPERRGDKIKLALLLFQFARRADCKSITHVGVSNDERRFMRFPGGDTILLDVPCRGHLRREAECCRVKGVGGR